MNFNKFWKSNWLRYLIIPSLICLVLFLVFVDVNFFVHAESGLKKLKFVKQPEIVQSTESSPDTHAEKATLCEEFNNNICKVKCKVGAWQQKVLRNELENLYKKCKDPLDLTLLASFDYGMFQKTDLVGDFILVNLTIENKSDLIKIDEYAFDKRSTNDLENLIILNTQLKSLTEKTFAGLLNIKFFKMINKQYNKEALNGKAFVKPMAATLNIFSFLHTSSTVKSFDPGDWLHGADLINLLEVDLKGNYFSDTLKSTSFETLKSVKHLNLQSCSINSLEENTFDPIMNTLLFLNLNDNALHTLSPYFLNKLASANVELSLASNNWDCTCDNFDFMHAVRCGLIQFDSEPKCFSPENLRGESISTLHLCYKENENECEVIISSTTENDKTFTATITNDYTNVASSTTPWDDTTVTTTTIEDDTNITFSTIPVDDTTVTSATTENETNVVSPTTPKNDTDNIELICKYFSNEQDSKKCDVNNRIVDFDVKSISSSSVMITLKLFPGAVELRLLYFKSQEEESSYYQTINSGQMQVNNLKSGESYVFCILPFVNELTSPSNCRSHNMGHGKVSEFIEPWLKGSKKTLFITLTTLGALVCLVTGSVGVYLLLRWRPMLLGSKHVFLKRSNSTLSTYGTTEALNTYAAGLQVDSSNYACYYSGAQLPSRKIEAINHAGGLPPHIRAPAVPPLSSLRPVSEQSTIPPEELMTIEELPNEFNEHEYQSLDEYQRIYEISCAKKL